MKRKSLAAVLAILLACTSLDGQMQHTDAAVEKSARSASTHTAYFIDPVMLDLALILPPPPPQDSDITKADLADIHRVEKLRTSQQVAAAQADDQEEDIFVFKNALGQNFAASNLPLTSALSAHIRNDAGVAGKPLKLSFARPRPFQVDSSLHPVCALTKEPNSYPSGHTLSGYLLALALM